MSVDEKQSTADTTSSTLSKVEQTSLFMAAGRAIESRKPESERAFYDPYAEIFAGTRGFEQLDRIIKTLKIPKPEMFHAHITFRTKYFDDMIKAAVGKIEKKCEEKGIKKLPKLQVVILGVGCDTRSYRLDILKGCHVFEVDMGDVIKFREEILAHKCKAKTEAIIKSVAGDLNDLEKFNLGDALIKQGYDTDNSVSIWICEGLISYLSSSSLDRVFRLASDTLCCKNETWKDLNLNWFVANCLNENTPVEDHLQQSLNVTFKSSFKTPHVLLEKYGYKEWSVVPSGGKCKDYKNDYLKQVENSANVRELAISFFFYGCK
ncbi:methyltransferase [Reticulomyxa filosa]|uniref:Methyltransferase n=1 Tax=Reticulomyxa filosa TaxID=46433 RepID=X6PC75_RETFI|nr:methyltransferase [Reticulomyxa filosa]|eukprot:ETO36120.1 methyltransferase [Reticulomyxa filosa]